MEFTFFSKMETEGLQLYQKYASLQVFTKIFVQMSSYL